MMILVGAGVGVLEFGTFHAGEDEDSPEDCQESNDC